MHDRIPSSLLLFVVAVGAAACGQDGPRGDPLKGGEPPRTTPPGRLPDGHPPIQKGLPDGHPPISGPDAQPPMPAKAAPPAASPFSWTAPEGWTETPPSSSMRVAQFDLPVKWPDGRPVVCAVFGGIGGGRQGNIDRWVTQFRQPDGSETKAKLAESKQDGVTVTRVEMTGAYVDGMQGLEAPDGMLLGAVVESEGSESVYVKLAGPRDLLAGQSAAFDAFLASIRKKQ